MARIQSVVGLLNAVRKVSWRDFRTFRSIGGQNFFVFLLLLVALQPQSGQFFVLILIIILLFPLSSDPTNCIPADRRSIWPLSTAEWTVLRIASWLFSPIAWIAVGLLLKFGWSASILVISVAAGVQLLRQLLKPAGRRTSTSWLHWIPKLPGVTGSLMRLQWREMLQTLDPYLALALVVCTELYRATGRPLDPAAPRILALMTALALSTQTQVLLALDGAGADRYRHAPIRGWQILLPKDAAFLILLGLLASPLNILAGLGGGIAALAIGHHRSVLNLRPQSKWRFTAGAIFPDGILQIVVVLAAGLNAGRLGIFALCCAAWLSSIVLYGWQWDRRRMGG